MKIITLLPACFTLPLLLALPRIAQSKRQLEGRGDAGGWVCSGSAAPQAQHGPATTFPCRSCGAFVQPQGREKHLF